MSAQHTPGPWRPVKDADTRSWLLLRDVLGAGGLCELMKTPAGFLALFPSEEAARDAIAEATGGAA